MWEGSGDPEQYKLLGEVGVTRTTKQKPRRGPCIDVGQFPEYAMAGTMARQADVRDLGGLRIGEVDTVITTRRMSR